MVPVGVHQHDDISAGLLDPPVERAGQPALALAHVDPHGRIAREDGLHVRGSAVGRRVVDDEDLHVEPGPAGDPQDLGDELGNALPLVVGGQDDGNHGPQLRGARIDRVIVRSTALDSAPARGARRTPWRSPRE